MKLHQDTILGIQGNRFICNKYSIYIFLQQATANAPGPM